MNLFSVHANSLPATYMHIFFESINQTRSQSRLTSSFSLRVRAPPITKQVICKYVMHLEQRNFSNPAPSQSIFFVAFRFRLLCNIWCIDVPPKVKIFAGKLSRNILPTKGNRFKRRLEATPTCDFTGSLPTGEVLAASHVRPLANAG